MKKSYKNSAWLRYQYITLNKGLRDVARLCDVHRTTILNWLRFFNIPIRPKGSRRKKGPWIKFNCKICGQFFWVTPSRKFRAKVCSPKCQLALVHKGNKKGDCFIVCANCSKRKKVWPANILEGRKFCSVKCQWEGRMGDKNPAWNGGTSREPYGIEFGPRLKEEIRKRDNYTCQFPDCGLVQNGRAFPVHHDDYNRKNNDKFNLITLCNHHHSRTNYDRDYWQIYLQDLQEIRLS